MNLDWWVGILTAFVVGLATNWSFQRYLDHRSTQETRRKYAGIAGKYTTYAFPKGSEEIDLAHPSGDCEIVHEKDNVLRLRYKERAVEHVWEATVWMDNPY